MPECARIEHHATPTETVRFSVLLGLGDEPQTQPAGQAPALACISIAPADLHPEAVVEVYFTQQWQLQRLLKGDVAHVQSLAPYEEVDLSVRQKLVSSLQRTTTTTEEETSAVESSSTAKDVYNVTRNSTRTRNWSVNAQATIPIKKVNLNLGGNIGSQVSNAINSSFNEVTGTTEKSSEQIRMSTKTEVVASSSEESETSSRRSIRNPYTDRSVDIVAFEVVKEYCVTLKIIGGCVSVRINMLQMTFDLPFIRNFSGFLAAELLDEQLAIELPDALLVATPALSGGSVADKIATAARLALRYLFDVPNIFNVSSMGNPNANLPSSSFDAQASDDGFEDARQEGATLYFTTLNFFWKIYGDLGANLTDDQAVEIAISIYESVGRRWLSLMDEGGNVDLREVLDENNRTEALRRLSGFAAYVQGVVQPLIKPNEEERAEVERKREAAALLDRVVQHLNCNRLYYVERLLVYLVQTTRGRALEQFVTQLVDDGIISAQAGLLAPERSYVDGHHVVVPCGEEFDAAETLAKLAELAEEPIDIERPGIERVSLPAAGAHFEAVASACLLPDLPSAYVGPANLTNVEAEVTVHPTS